MQKILFLQENGNVGVISPSVSVEDSLSQVPVGLSYLIVDDNQLPSEEDFIQFTDALTADFGNLEKPDVRIDLKKAKQITKERLRRERIKLFEANDIAIRDAMIESNKIKLEEAIKERDRLRNITTIVDNVSSLDELKKLHP
jgi:hypothetical protein